MRGIAGKISSGWDIAEKAETLLKRLKKNLAFFDRKLIFVLGITVAFYYTTLKLCHPLRFSFLVNSSNFQWNTRTQRVLNLHSFLIKFSNVHNVSMFSPIVLMTSNNQYSVKSSFDNFWPNRLHWHHAKALLNKFTV